MDGMDKAALFAPADAGEKTACTVHVDNGVIVWPEQLSFWIPNSEAFVPAKVIVPIKRSTVPLLKIVKVSGTDVPPTFTFPKLLYTGDMEISEVLTHTGIDTIVAPGTVGHSTLTAFEKADKLPVTPKPTLTGDE